MGSLTAAAAAALGGAVGSLARHGVNVGVAHLVARQAPYATAAVNLAGSLAVGLLAGLMASGRLNMSSTARTFVFVGLLGGFTTFSSLMSDTLMLVHTGERTLALSNVLAQVVLGLCAVYGGYYLVTR